MCPRRSSRRSGWRGRRHAIRCGTGTHGEELPETELNRLGLPPGTPLASHVLQAIAAVHYHSIPTVICCDQMESLLKDKDECRSTPRN